jgi:hypothetical protein
MTIADKCPNCGAHRGRASVIVCYNPWHDPEAVRYTKEPSNVMCQPGTSASATNKAIADKAARELAQLIKDDLRIDIDVSPILLRLWLVERWDAVAKLAHQIHGST